jgi:hypothetical protein
MRRLILKTTFFVAPFFLLHLLNVCFYKQFDGDLARIGYLYQDPSPKSALSGRFSLDKKYIAFSELTPETNLNFDVMIIGDSFSEQDSLGYKNFLAHENISVLHVDRVKASNPIQILVELINGDFFDSVKINYVVLQSVEREFLPRCQEIDFHKSMSMDSLSSVIKNQKKLSSSEMYSKFFSETTLKAPLTNIQYYFYDKPEYSQTYKVSATSTNLFSNNPGDLLFLDQDIATIKYKNDSSLAANANNVLNTINSLLNKRNIKLIVLISPDKYDMYYRYISNNQRFKKPLFFTYYDSLVKDYHYVPSMKVLSNELQRKEDIYYYDDTHWSPVGAKIIAKEIKKIVDNE